MELVSAYIRIEHSLDDVPFIDIYRDVRNLWELGKVHNTPQMAELIEKKGLKEKRENTVYYASTYTPQTEEEVFEGYCYIILVHINQQMFKQMQGLFDMIDLNYKQLVIKD